MVFLALMQFARMVRPPSGEAVANAKSFEARVVAVGRDPDLRRARDCHAPGKLRKGAGRSPGARNLRSADSMRL
jgi:hypothetical protein